MHTHRRAARSGGGAGMPFLGGDRPVGPGDPPATKKYLRTLGPETTRRERTYRGDISAYRSGLQELAERTVLLEPDPFHTRRRDLWDEPEQFRQWAETQVAVAAMRQADALETAMRATLDMMHYCVEAQELRRLHPTAASLARMVQEFRSLTLACLQLKEFGQKKQEIDLRLFDARARQLQLATDAHDETKALVERLLGDLRDNVSGAAAAARARNTQGGGTDAMDRLQVQNTQVTDTRCCLSLSYFLHPPPPTTTKGAARPDK